MYRRTEPTPPGLTRQAPATRPSRRAARHTTPAWRASAERPVFPAGAEAATVRTKGRPTTMSERPQTRARKRLGRCYELAWKSLYNMKDPGGWRLAHGEVDCYDPASDSPRMGHAWLETRDEVFDPVANEYFSKDDYYSLGYPTNVRRYTRKEAAQRISAEGIWGPFSAGGHRDK